MLMEDSSVTILQGSLSDDARERLVSIALQLEMTEAEAAEWALKRCGLEVIFPNPAISGANTSSEGG